MKNLKYSIRAIILAGTISLTGCGQATPIIEAETETEITIEATIENQENQENEERENFTKENEEIENFTQENEEIENSTQENEETESTILTINEYNLSDLYLNFYSYNDSSLNVSIEKNGDAIQSVSLTDLCEIYHYDFEYNHENDTISDKQIEELKGKVEDSLKYYMCSFSNTNYQQYIPIDKICIVDSIDFEDNKILASRCAAVRSFEELSFPVYSGSHRLVMPEGYNELKRYNVEELFPEIIKNINYLEDNGMDTETTKCISIFDLALIDYRPIYNQELNDLCEELLSIDQEQIEEFEDSILEQAGLSLNDTFLRFDPNVYKNIDTAIETFKTNHQDLDNISDDIIATKYINLNYQFLNNDTIQYICDKYQIDDTYNHDDNYNISNNYYTDLIADNNSYQVHKILEETGKYHMGTLRSKGQNAYKDMCIQYYMICLVQNRNKTLCDNALSFSPRNYFLSNISVYSRDGVFKTCIDGAPATDKTGNILYQIIISSDTDLNEQLIKNSYLANKELAPIEDTKEMIKK